MEEAEERDIYLWVVQLISSSLPDLPEEGHTGQFIESKSFISEERQPERYITRAHHTVLIHTVHDTHTHRERSRF